MTRKEELQEQILNLFKQKQEITETQVQLLGEKIEILSTLFAVVEQLSNRMDRQQRIIEELVEIVAPGSLDYANEAVQCDKREGRKAQFTIVKEDNE